MKRLILVISILFLTLNLYGKDFVMPDMQMSVNDIFIELYKNYGLEYQSETGITYFETDDLYYVGQKINKLSFKLSEKEGNALIILFNEMTEEEWLTTLLRIMLNNDLVVIDEESDGFTLTPLSSFVEMKCIYKINEIDNKKSIFILLK